MRSRGEGRPPKDMRYPPVPAGPRARVCRVKVGHEGVFVVGGIRNVDAHADGELRYRGVVEWGFRAHDVLKLLREAKTPRRTSPFVDAPRMRSAV
jgi:hypothetical protein